MGILAISGSLRAASTNTAVLNAAVKSAPRNIELLVYDRIGHLPYFNLPRATAHGGQGQLFHTTRWQLQFLRLKSKRCGGYGVLNLLPR